MFVGAYRQELSVPNMGGHHCGRQIWADTARSSNIVRLPHRRVETARALVNVIATDNAHTGSAEWELHHPFWQTFKLAPRLAVALQTISRLAALGGIFETVPV
jgi:hypothetical protein